MKTYTVCLTRDISEYHGCLKVLDFDDGDSQEVVLL